MRRKVIIVLSIFTAFILFNRFVYRDLTRVIFGLEGRYSNITEMKTVFNGGQVKDGMDSSWHYYDDGSWVHVLATDSHHGGGTIGVLESSGKQHFYFGHVCGFGEGIFVWVGGDRFDPDQEGKVK